MKKKIPILVRKISLLIVITILGGLFGATLVRYSPGYGVDERELDTRLNSASVQAIRDAHHQNPNLLRYYAEYLVTAAHGDFGTSESLQRPILELVKERFFVTARTVSLGLACAWIAAFLLAILSQFLGGWLFEICSTLFSGLLLALPSTIVALLFVYFRGPVFLAIGCVTFPKLFRYIHNLLAQAYEQPYVLAARARGIGAPRIFLKHVLSFASPALLALLGVSTSMAFGAAIPIEALSDSPGLGQLAWFAAINRDLPLIMNLTLIVTLITVTSNSLADYSRHFLAKEA